MSGARVTDEVSFWSMRGELRRAVRVVRVRKPERLRWRAALTPVAQKARKVAHGTPALLWIDLPVDGTGAADFKALLKAKLRTMPPPPPPAA